MKVAELLERRRGQWRELEQLSSQLEQRLTPPEPAKLTRFASLYRAACADLALADINQFPQQTVQYLHRLVGRAHNQLYRARRFDLQSWKTMLLDEVPKRVFQDRCVQSAFILFWGAFLISAALASTPSIWPEFSDHVLGKQMDQLEDNFSQPLSGRRGEENLFMAAFYISHNTGIGLKCFAGGVLFIPGVLTTLFNAVVLGASFGHMARPGMEDGAGRNFFEFVTAHGPFELTAIVLSAGAGLRLGMSWLQTEGQTRRRSLTEASRDTMPLMGAAMVLFFLAALIEAFVSPSPLPYPVKAVVAVFSSGLLMFYFVILGYPRET